MFEHGVLWGLAAVLGPLLLLAAMVYGVMMYRRRGPRSKKLTEDRTRALYRQGGQRERRQEATAPAFAAFCRPTLITAHFAFETLLGASAESWLAEPRKTG